MRNYFIPCKDAYNRKVRKRQRWLKMWRNWNLTHCWWDVKWHSLFGKPVGSSSKVKPRVRAWPSNSTPGHTSEEMENICRHRHLLGQFTAAFFMTCPKLETTHMSINRWVDKQDVGQADSGIWYGHQEEWSSDTHYDMGDLENMMLNGITSPMLYDSTYAECPELANSWRLK